MQVESCSQALSASCWCLNYQSMAALATTETWGRLAVPAEPCHLLMRQGHPWELGVAVGTDGMVQGALRPVPHHSRLCLPSMTRGPKRDGRSPLVVHRG